MVKTARSYTFIHLNKTPECDVRTDGRTDRIAVAITAVCIASDTGRPLRSLELEGRAKLQ